MSRSRQKSWVHKWACARSEKFYKRLRASRERIAARLAIHHGDYERAEVEQVRWDEWHTGRDGYVGYWSEAKARESCERTIPLIRCQESVEQRMYRLFGK